MPEMLIRPLAWARGRWARRERHRLGFLAWISGLAAILFAFARLADEVLEGDTHGFDRAILLALRNPADLSDPLGPVWLENAARDLTSLGGYPVLVLVTLAVIGFLLVVRKHRAALLVLIAVGGGMVLSTGLKMEFDRPRPELVSHVVQVYTKSFPSGHAMLSAATYLTLAALLARVQPERRVKIYLLSVAVLLTLLIGSSRVYLGVHWPTDVLGGWSAGAAWAMACWMAAMWLQRRGEVERPPPERQPGGAES